MKKVLVLVLIFLGVLVLVACVKEKDTRTLERLNVATQPTKLVYVEGETFNHTGIKVEAVYKTAKGEEVFEDVTAKVTYDKTTLAVTDTKVVVSYKEEDVVKQAEIAITVNSTKALIGDGIIYEQKPTSDLKISVGSGLSSQVTAYWYTEYQSEGFYIKAIVEDHDIRLGKTVYNGDGIEVLLSKVGRNSGIADGSFHGK